MEGLVSGLAMLSRFLLELEGEGHSAATIRTYRCVLGRWQGSGMGAVEFLASLSLSLSSRRYYGRVLKHYFSWAKRRGIIQENPLEGLCFRAPPSKPICPLTALEVSRLLAACHEPREAAAVLVLYDCGLRASEFLHLAWRDVDIEAFTLRVNGKGDRQRLVGISPKALGALLECPTLFAGVTIQSLERMMRRLGDRAGVAEVRPHRLRHTFAHNWLANGGDIGDLRVLLGHQGWGQTSQYASYFEAERAVLAHRRFSPAARLESNRPSSTSTTGPGAGVLL